jgi:hypothetical protein
MAEARRRPSIRRLVARRAGFRCEYCLCPENHGLSTFAIEHIIPVKAGGQDVETNMAYSCPGCNSFKAVATVGLDEITGETVALYHPRQHVWAEHFAWNDDYSLLIGRTAIGRVTVEKLRLNREGVVNLRHLLREFGFHPPDAATGVSSS